MNEELFGELHEQEEYGLFGKEHQRQQCFLHGVMHSYYLQHKNGFNLFMGLLVLLYVNLMLPVMVRRRDYPQSYVEWIV